MKRLLFYLVVILLSVCLGLILEKMSPTLQPKLLTVDTEYSFLMDEDQVGTFSLYINDLSHDIVNESMILRIILEDLETKDLIELTLYEIDLGHDEVYLNEVFTRVFLKFIVPNLSEDWVFDDANLRVELNNQSEFSLRLGRVTFLKRGSDEVMIDWSSLDGLKRTNDLRSRLGEIHLSFIGSLKPILSVEIGTHVDVSFQLSEDTLTLYIPTDDYLLYDVPLRLHFNDGTTFSMSNFIYIVDYQILKESGPMINVYQLD